MTTRALLLINLGSPASPSVPDVRRYLHEFLMDRYVIDVPYLVRKMIVCGAILPRRPVSSAEAYRSIWWAEGSPLVVLSERLRAGVAAGVEEPVVLAMRYGEPSIPRVVKELRAAHSELRELVVLPLYPHYAASTWRTAVEGVERAVARHAKNVSLTVVRPFYDNPRYVAALVDRAAPYLAAGYDHLLFSYHGLPERHLRKEDPTGSHCLARPDCCERPSPAHERCYRAHVRATTRAFAAAAELSPEAYSVAYQSRLGRTPWLQPYADEAITALARGGVRKLLVMCPAFVADCLETLEEIGMRARESFLDAGGREFELIPCLNDSAACVDTIIGLYRDAASASPS